MKIQEVTDVEKHKLEVNRIVERVWDTDLFTSTPNTTPSFRVRKTSEAGLK